MEELVEIAKIFSDGNRLKIAVLILREEEVCVCEICDTLLLSQPLVSRHLKLMRKAGILEIRQDGRWMIYSLTEKPSPLLSCWIDEIRKYDQLLPELKGCKTRK